MLNQHLLNPCHFLINGGAWLKCPEYPKSLSQEGQVIALVKDIAVATDGGRKKKSLPHNGRWQVSVPSEDTAQV